MKKVLLVAIIFSAVFPFTGCKKGEDDPFFSIHSRKARVTGNWKIVYSNVVSVYTDTSGTQTISTVSDGETYTTTLTTPMGTTVTTGVQTMQYEFFKNGTYKSNHYMGGMAMIDNGSWDFTSGVGSKKNKSQITIYSQSQVSMGSNITYTGNYVNIAYDLKELRNNKMVWYYKTSSTQTGGYSTAYEIEYVFEPM